jgi:hypothetical protein
VGPRAPRFLPEHNPRVRPSARNRFTGAKRRCRRESLAAAPTSLSSLSLSSLFISSLRTIVWGGTAPGFIEVRAESAMEFGRGAPHFARRETWRHRWRGCLLARVCAESGSGGGGSPEISEVGLGRQLRRTQPWNHAPTPVFAARLARLWRRG